jgi:acyl-[acyl-carrier-protein]-phospholipid O-acyltransferase/long-chain-fatty-acid--[acyl-carrier-protein] ligase
MVIAGAEKLKPEIKKAFEQKFALKIYEGYGTTETSPVISVNMPDRLDIETMRPIIGNKLGSVGQGIPGTVVKIVDPSTMRPLPVGEDGLIVIAGPQVMKGYLDDPLRTEEAIVEIDGIRYYKSGDKGHLDKDGFIFIVDRYSRFAKIGAEMISLGSIEQQLRAILGEDMEFAIVALPDTKKGEQIVMLYASKEPIDAVEKSIRDSDLIPMMRPAKIYKVEQIPKLGTGKSDFGGAKRVAIEMIKADKKSH